ncbi:KRF1 protein, partial [Crypturellus undulatus]|nr:KRF1 protein [Crypturellus undulatus]
PAKMSGCHARPCGNEPCVRQCQASTVVIEPPPDQTHPQLLSSFPQNTTVESSISDAVGCIISCEGIPISSDCCDLSRFSSLYCGRRCPPC